MKCLLFHKWSEWKEYVKDVPTDLWLKTGRKTTQIKVPVVYEKRTCERCNKVQERTLGTI